MKKPVVFAIAGVAVVVLVVVVAIVMRKKGNDKQKDANVLVELRPKAGDPDSVVDPESGRKMYEQNCVTCHGWRGEGDGPSDPYLWRRPRNIADASYMNARTDAQLLDVIKNGGRDSKSQLSRIMPAWSTTFSTHQQDDIVAWVRRLSPSIADFVPEGRDFARYETVLNPARAAQVKEKSGSDLAPGDRTLAFYAVWVNEANRPRRVDEPAPAPGSSNLGGYVAFTRVPVAEGKSVTIGLSISPSEKKISRAAIFEKVVILDDGKRDEESADNLMKSFLNAGDNIGSVAPSGIPGHDDMAKVLGDAVKRLYWRLVLALEQDKEDWDDIKAGKAPNASMPGAALFKKHDCAKCHGPTGRVKGPGVSEKDFIATNLADETRMGKLSDEYLTELFEKGGPRVNISGSMPSFSLTPEESKALVEYVKSLSK